MANPFENSPRQGVPPDDARNASPFLGAGTHITHSISELHNAILGSALRMGDAAEAQKDLETVASSAFEAKYGAQIVWHTERVTHYGEALQGAKATFEALRQRDARTPAWIPANSSHHEGDGDALEEIPFGNWALRHKFEMPLLLAGIGGLFAASMITAQANLAATGLEVFSDYPALSWSMAALAPLTGLAIKTIGSALRSTWSRAAFTMGLSISMVGSFAIWLALYADIYHGLSSTVRLGGLFDEPTLWGKLRETLFTATTISTEVLVASVLAHRATSVAEHYSPDFERRNPEKAPLRKELDAAKAEVEALFTNLTNEKAALSEFERSRDLTISVLTLAHKGRRGAQSQPGL